MAKIRRIGTGMTSPIASMNPIANTKPLLNTANIGRMMSTSSRQVKSIRSTGGIGASGGKVIRLTPAAAPRMKAVTPATGASVPKQQRRLEHPSQYNLRTIAERERIFYEKQQLSLKMTHATSGGLGSYGPVDSDDPLTRIGTTGVIETMLQDRLTGKGYRIK